jgi:hypothetical protein
VIFSDCAAVLFLSEKMLRPVARIGLYTHRAILSTRILQPLSAVSFSTTYT